MPEVKGESDSAYIKGGGKDLLSRQKVAVTLSKGGLVKRTPVQVFIPQMKGIGGIINLVTKEVDALRILLVADTHDDLLFFTNKGKVFHITCDKLPFETSRKTEGTALINLIPIGENERVTAIVAVPDFASDTYLIIATRYGKVKKTTVDRFVLAPSRETIAIDLNESDELVTASLVTDKDDIIQVTKKGQSIRFSASELRTSLITNSGVRSIHLQSNDEVISMDIVRVGASLLVLTSGGFGKLTPIVDYPQQHRAGSGVRTIKLTEITGEVTTARVVINKSQWVIIVSAMGICLYKPTRQIAIQGRNTRGVRLLRLSAHDSVVAIFSFKGS